MAPETDHKSGGAEIARIEAALARLEALAAAPRANPPAADQSDLARRHQQLREAVTGALGDLDALIARAKP